MKKLLIVSVMILAFELGSLFGLMYGKPPVYATEIAASIDLSTEEEKSLTETIIVLPDDDFEFPTVVYPEPGEEWITMQATAFCACSLCCGSWAFSVDAGKTASGAKATEGRTIAADPSYPFGTVFYIDGLGERVVEDRGSAIIGNHIDLYFESHEDACAWGMQEVRVRIVQ